MHLLRQPRRGVLQTLRCHEQVCNTHSLVAETLLASASQLFYHLRYTNRPPANRPRRVQAVSFCIYRLTLLALEIVLALQQRFELHVCNSPPSVPLRCCSAPSSCTLSCRSRRFRSRTTPLIDPLPSDSSPAKYILLSPLLQLPAILKYFLFIPSLQFAKFSRCCTYHSHDAPHLLLARKHWSTWERHESRTLPFSLLTK